MPITFPDGTTAELRYPPELDLAHTSIQPYTSAGGPPEVGRDFTAVYGQAEEVLTGWEEEGGRGKAELLTAYPDGRGGSVGFWRTSDSDYLAFQFGSWTVLVYDYQEPGARMSDEQRSLWATHLRGQETSGGWLILEADPPLWLTRAGEHAGPQINFWYPGVVRGVLLFAGECTPLRAGEGFKEEDIEIVDGVSIARTKNVHGDWFAFWCDPKVPMQVHVYSGQDEALIDAVISGLEIRSGPTATPTSH
jgi:hypothetical protein